MEKIVGEALELLETITYHNYEWSNEKGDTRRIAKILEFDALSMINSQFDQLTKRLDRMQANVIRMKALSQMPSYVKFLKEILSKKKRLEDYETITLIEECSAILQNKLPPKLEDPGSFSIPCLIGNMNIDKALYDLGASMSLMPLSICQKLDVGELKPTTISVQLVDQSVKYPIGILENIPIKVGKFFIPIDFVVLEMEDDI
ncbi:uncharacterized protein LOC131171216 [Hevea brasiliensis]|uniref:uncharacterized protein LOC131171216 n=1 Tax=Hevea brasiliensis TaxID=3981 RepID=UPI0025D4DF1B|nr:uncharacterized protein LOC131171216 [Hevea brasiliensis]